MAEEMAWRALLKLGRLNWKTHTRRECDNQIIIRVVPGELYTHVGAPLVQISARHADLDRRVRVCANTLASAVEALRRNLERLGAKLD